MFFEVRGTWFRLETKTGAWVHVVSTLSLVIYPSFSISIFRTNFFWTFFLSPRFDKHPHLAILWKHKNISSLALFSRRRQWHPTPVLLPGKSHGWRSLVGCSPWGREKSDTTERLHFHFSLSCVGEGNGNPLQCSCLENPRDGGAWWAAVYGVAQSRTRLKRLSSSSNSSFIFHGLLIYSHSFSEKTTALKFLVQ